MRDEGRAVQFIAQLAENAWRHIAETLNVALRNPSLLVAALLQKAEQPAGQTGGYVPGAAQAAHALAIQHKLLRLLVMLRYQRRDTADHVGKYQDAHEEHQSGEHALDEIRRVNVGWRRRYLCKRPMERHDIEVALARAYMLHCPPVLANRIPSACNQVHKHYHCADQPEHCNRHRQPLRKCRLDDAVQHGSVLQCAGQAK
mmetsp:Transcript_73215/g.212002  ORF Transcript_73215/g.212002 Transcript_73215/m.212002 type:complete len:201 (-) Transcript_73215:814-1416(-)